MKTKYTVTYWLNLLSLPAIGVAVAMVWLLTQQTAPLSEPPAPAPKEQSHGTVHSQDELANGKPYYSSRTNPPARTSSAVVDRGTASKQATSPGTDRRRPATVSLDNQSYPLRTYNTMLVPNDPAASQWWVTETKLPQLWDVPEGASQPLLAIIDTGFGMQHEEFMDRWYSNPGESGASGSQGPSQLNCTDRGLPLHASCNLIDDDADGIIDNEHWSVTYQNPSRLNCSALGRPISKDCNRLDDDGNGYIDDSRGWDFANNDNNPQAGELNPAGSGTTHGTRVAGIAAATGNNTKGIAGADWHSRILPIQALDDDSYGDTLGVGRAILYAASQGADIISLSLGSDLPDEYVRQAVKQATAAGSVVVAASGNDGCSCMVYPANYPEVLAVGALDTNRLRAGFSSYGANLDILAPGTGMTTATWNAGNGSSAYVSNVNGTSFATPLVSGVLARMLAQQPTSTPLQLMAALTENSDRLGLSANLPRTDTVGFGTIDAAQAVQRMLSGQSPAFSYNYTPVSLGRQTTPPLETAGSYQLQRCTNSRPGSTALYELIRNQSASYTISPTERWQAGLGGSASKLFGYACLQQVHDTTGDSRQLNLHKDFRDLTIDQTAP